MQLRYTATGQKLRHYADSVDGCLCLDTITHNAHAAIATGMRCIAMDRAANQPVSVSGHASAKAHRNRDRDTDHRDEQGPIQRAGSVPGAGTG